MESGPLDVTLGKISENRLVDDEWYQGLFLGQSLYKSHLAKFPILLTDMVISPVPFAKDPRGPRVC